MCLRTSKPLHPNGRRIFPFEDRTCADIEKNAANGVYLEADRNFYQTGSKGMLSVPRLSIVPSAFRALSVSPVVLDAETTIVLDSHGLVKGRQTESSEVKRRALIYKLRQKAGSWTAAIVPPPPSFVVTAPSACHQRKRTGTKSRCSAPARMSACRFATVHLTATFAFLISMQIVMSARRVCLVRAVPAGNS
jgi:hypothetical protein